MPAQPPRSGGPASPITVRADWDDLAAAIDRAAPSAAVAPIRSSDADTPTNRRRVVELLAIDGQTAHIVFTAERTGDPRPITIEAVFGSPDDPGRAAALARLVATELEALAGREIAPR